MQQNKSTMRGILQLLPRAPLWHRVQMIITFSVLLMMGCSVQRWSAFAQQCDPAEEMPDVQGKGKWKLGLAKSPHSHNYIRSISNAQSMFLDCPAQSMDSHAIICGLRVRAQVGSPWILPCARKAWIKTIHGLFCANYGSTLCNLRADNIHGFLYITKSMYLDFMHTATATPVDPRGGFGRACRHSVDISCRLLL